MTTVVAVDVACVWVSPDSPREVDEPVVADDPDSHVWTTTMTDTERRDLVGRLDTQLVEGEPVVVLDESGDWSRIAAPWQPSPKLGVGYPGWVRTAHLTSAQRAPTTPAASIEADLVTVVADARRHLGLRYLWGGTSEWGLDCSGLVHQSYRRAGIVVPRDADAQYTATERVAAPEVMPGDLVFFGDSIETIDHVGFVSADDELLHAPGTAANGHVGRIELTRLSVRTGIVGYGRVSLAAPHGDAQPAG